MLDGLDARTKDINETVTAVHMALADHEELEIEAAAEDSPEEATQSIQDGIAPADIDAYAQLIRSQVPGFKFSSVDELSWRRKQRCDGGRGNLGWFAENTTGDRCYVYRGRGERARKAIPRELLDAWESATGLAPCAIRIDYRAGTGKGAHPWRVQTYGGDVWSIFKGGRSGGITVKQIQDEN